MTSPLRLRHVEGVVGGLIVVLGMAIPSHVSNAVSGWIVCSGVVWTGCFLIADPLFDEG